MVAVDKWIDDSLDRFRDVADSERQRLRCDLGGWWGAYRLERETRWATPQDMRNALTAANCPENTLLPTEGGKLCSVYDEPIVEQWFTGPVLTFWRASVEGRVFVAQTYHEDVGGNHIFETGINATKVADLISHAFKICEGQQATVYLNFG